MNCFEWQSRSSDYLDGALAAALKTEADLHLEGCVPCKRRHQHYRQILSSVAGQPRAELPSALRKSPLSALIPAQGMAKTLRARWERIPWFIRTTLEGTSIVLIILLGISVGPKLRALYERRIERSMGEFSEGFGGLSSEDSGRAAANAAAVPLARGKTAAATPASDDYSGEDEQSDDDVAAEDTAGDNLHVGNAEIWRFNLKTDDPHEIRPKIVQAMIDLKIPSTTPGFGGTEAPGGIQFDLLVPKGVILDLKKQLQKLAPKPSGEAVAEGSLGESFTWYKNRSKKPIPAGKTRVVIWLSQM